MKKKRNLVQKQVIVYLQNIDQALVVQKLASGIHRINL